MAFCFILSKVSLFLLDFLFVLIGLFVVAIGIWTVVDSRSFFETVAFFAKKQASVLEMYADTYVVIIAASVLIAIGGIVLILSFCGCWGVVSENRCLLITYATLMSLIALVEIVCVILLFAMRDQWQSKVNEKISAEFSKNYRGTLGAFKVSEFDPFSLAADSFMIEFQCCGVHGPDDFRSEETAYAWITEGRKFHGETKIYEGNEVQLPTACCQFSNTTFFRDQQYTMYLNYMVNKECPVSKTDYNSATCLSVIPTELDKHKIPLIVTPVVILLLELTCIGLAVYLAIAIKRWGEELYY